MAKLHIICGNCGSTDLKFKNEILALICKDCATLHFLEGYGVTRD